ncbi:endospore germination permease [Neobacillus niacini]|uniref:GerAB/ArcD/ProY family transporter n=1 Tax=Neobacillus niacini TaxID=86668 RepID=UPI002FFE5AD4
MSERWATHEAGKNMNEKSITLNQLFFVIVQAQIGISLLSIPFKAHKYAKGNAWISVIIAGLIVQIFVLIIWMLMKRHKGKTILEISQTVLGKYIGNLVNFSYLLYGVLVMSNVVILYADIIERWILETTPKTVMIFLIIATGIYLGKQNLRVIARFFTIVNVLVFLLFVLSFFAFSNNLSFTNLLPISQSSFTDMFKGSTQVTSALLGFEILLFIFPFVLGQEKQMLKKMTSAIATVVIIYLYFAVLTLATFSQKEIAIVPEPVLYMLKGLNFRVVERIDMIFLSYWIIPMTTSFVVYLYIASSAAGKMFHKGKRKYPVWYLSILVFGIAYFFSDAIQIQTFNHYTAVISLIFIFGIPLFLLLLSIIFKNRGIRA